MKYAYILLLFLFSCKKEAELVLHKFQEQGPNTLKVEKMLVSFNYILHIGKDSTLYDINQDENSVPYNYFYQPLFIPENVDTLAHLIKQVQFRVLVDTSSRVQIPFYPDIPNDIPGPQISNWIDEHRKMVNAYPVYIWNPSDKITTIPVEGVTTELIQEAKDENGEWRPIEYATNGFCGNGKWNYVLMPDYYAITSVYKYSGQFETELRVKFTRGNKDYYSNIFKGKINPKQFEPLIF